MPSDAVVDVIVGEVVVIEVVEPVTTVIEVSEAVGPRGAAGVVQAIIAGTNVTVNSTDPANPVINATGNVAGPASATGAGIALFDGTTGKLIKNSTSFVQDAAGNVGIGTTTPSSALEVKGTVTIDNPTNSDIATLNLTSPYYARLNCSIIPRQGKSEVRFVTKGASAGTGQTYFVVASSENDDIGNNLLMGVAAGSAFVTNAYDYQVPGDLQLGGESWAGRGAMTITGAGKVGIATAAPTAALDVPASTTAQSSLRIRAGVAPTAPNDGDIWFDGTDMKIRIAGVTKTITVT